MAVVRHGSTEAIGKVVDIYDGTGVARLHISQLVVTAASAQSHNAQTAAINVQASSRPALVVHSPHASRDGPPLHPCRHARRAAHPAGSGGPGGRTHGAGAIPQVHRAARGRGGAAPDDRPARGAVRHRRARQAAAQEPAQQAAQALTAGRCWKVFCSSIDRHGAPYTVQCDNC